MYLLYVDESGDTGLPPKSPTRYFILTALVIHETAWRKVVDEFRDFRQQLRTVKQLPVSVEIHASPFAASYPLEGLEDMSRYDRVDVLRRCIRWIGSRSDVQIVTVAVDKKGKPSGYDVFDAAWRVLLQRIDKTMYHRNFLGAYPDQRALLLPDNTDGQKLLKLLDDAQLRSVVVELPILKDSAQSQLNQLADVVAFMARQLYERTPYLAIKNWGNIYSQLGAARVKHVAPDHPEHIIEL